MDRMSSMEQVKEEVVNGNHDFFILLNGGLRSSKHITFDPIENEFWVWNLIDDSEEYLDGHPNIKEAIGKGAFYMEVV